MTLHEIFIEKVLPRHYVARGLLIFILSLSLTACFDPEEDTEPPASQDETEDPIGGGDVPPEEPPQQPPTSPPASPPGSPAPPLDPSPGDDPEAPEAPPDEDPNPPEEPPEDPTPPDDPPTDDPPADDPPADDPPADDPPADDPPADDPPADDPPADDPPADDPPADDPPADDPPADDPPDEEEPPPSGAGVEFHDKAFWLDGRKISTFGLRAANALQDDDILDRLIGALDDLKAHGIQSLAISMQGGRYTEGGNSNMNAYHSNGDINATFASRLTRLLDETAQRDMVLVVMFFYRGRDEQLSDANAVRKAVENTTLLAMPWRNAWFHVINEPGHSGYDHDILKTDSGQKEIYNLVKSIDPTRVTHVSIVDGANDGFHSDTSGRRVKHVESAGNVIVEYDRQDSYDDAGQFSSSARSTAIDRATQNHENGAYWFWHAAWHQRADGPGWPRWDKGGAGTSSDPGVSFIFDAMKALSE